MASLSVDFTVHNVTVVPVRREGEFNGEKISAVVECVEVELTSPAPHGSLTLRFTGAEAALAKVRFKSGAVVSWKL